MTEAACEHQYVGLAGCGSSGKTDFLAIWGIVNFLCSPHNTKVLATSTTLKDARKRVWGSIREYWMAVPNLPGKVVDSAGMIRFDDGSGQNPYSDKVGLELIPCEKSQEKEAIGRLIGFKAHRLILLADELTELTEAILTAAYSNMSLNPEFQMIGAGNTNSHFDAFGIFTEPEEGWTSVTVDSESWKTKRGVCLHFDGLRSPNLELAKDAWPIYGRKQLAEHAKLGEGSAAYWRMCRGYFCPEGSENTIYSEADIVKFEANKSAVWKTPPTKIAALDPAFTTNGDRVMVYIGFVGRDLEDKLVVEFDRSLQLKEDIRKTDMPINFQFAQQFRDVCIAEGILPQHAAIDSTGGGGPFSDIVAEVWSPQVYRVKFGGKASDTPVSETDKSPGHSRYADRVSEIWYRGYDLLRNGQLKGITPQLAKEMCSRNYTTEKAGDLRVKVESKKEVKKRIGKSPDLADSAFILLALAVERMSAKVNKSQTLDPFGRKPMSAWKKFLHRTNAVNSY